MSESSVLYVVHGFSQMRYTAVWRNQPEPLGCMKHYIKTYWLLVEYQTLHKFGRCMMNIWEHPSQNLYFYVLSLLDQVRPVVVSQDKSYRVPLCAWPGLSVHQLDNHRYAEIHIGCPNTHLAMVSMITTAIINSVMRLSIKLGLLKHVGFKDTHMPASW